LFGVLFTIIVRPDVIDIFWNELIHPRF
jgi:hypothetical protein